MEKPNTPAPAAAPTIAPIEALKNLAIIADDHPLRVKERDAINASIKVLLDLIKNSETVKNSGT